jgi:CubicO group peptidase (beta-lactamase class C family)
LSGCAPAAPADEKAEAGAKHQAASAPEQPFGSARALAKDLSQGLINEQRAGGLSIALVDGAEIVWADGYGVVSPTEDRAVTAQTPFRAGSLAKPLLAAAVMQEVEKETLSLDDPLAQHVEFSIQSRFPDARAITIRDVLTHRSGLPADDLRFAWAHEPRDWHELPDALSDEYLASPPGRALSYSNVAFTLLGRALEQVEQSEFDRAMQLRVLRPLRMFGTSFGPAPAHRARGGGPDLQPGLVPATGLTTNAMDLARFASMVLSKGERGGHRVLSEESVAEMLRIQNGDSRYDFRTRVGLGWKRTHRRLGMLGDVVWHDGQVPGYQAQMILLPLHGLAIVVLATSRDAAAVEDLSVAVLERAIDEKGKHWRNDPAPYATLEEVPNASGLYAAQGGVLSVAADADQLAIDSWPSLAPGLLDGEPDGGLRRSRPGVYAGAAFEVSFARVDDQVFLVGTKDGVQGRLAERFEPRPVPEPWRQRVGKWQPEAADPWTGRSEIELVRDDGFLRLRFSSDWGDGEATEWALVPISPQMAVIAGLGRGKGETIVAERRDGREFLRWQGIRLRPAGD